MIEKCVILSMIHIICWKTDSVLHITSVETSLWSPYITSAPILQKTPLPTIPPLRSNVCLFSSCLAMLGYLAVDSKRILYSSKTIFIKLQKKYIVTASNNSTSLLYFPLTRHFSEITYIISTDLHRSKYTVT